jgi:uncharacterized membrane protein YgcG
MKKSLLILLAFTIGVIASAQEIKNINTRVRLFKTGNALVVQNWDITVTEGTEWYIPIDNPGKSYIRDFRVFENDKEFANDGDDWSSSRSMDAKAHRCGIIRKSGGNIELCWGLGSYGHHEFTIMYIIENLVQSYDECDGFHWHFLNDEWSVRPQSATITFINDTDGDKWYWNDENDCNVRFWGFGMIGNSGIEDGVIRFESTEPFRYKSFFSALMSFNKGLFSPRVEGDGTFEKLKKTAFEGSDYGDDDEKMEKIIGIVIFCLIIFLPALLVLYIIYKLLCMLYWKVSGHRYVKKIFGKTKIDGWWRSVPLEGSPTALFSLLFEGDNLITNATRRFPNLVSAYFLKWIQDGLLAVERDEKKPDRVNLRFVKGTEEVAFDDAMEKKIYNAALQAAGDNLLLEKNEFKTWSYKHDQTVIGWPMEAVNTGHVRWEEASMEDRCHAVEFKNYLEDFTVMDQREAPEVGLWKQYMVLAASLGIAERVAKNFEKLFPRVMEEYSRQTNMMDAATTYLILRDITSSSSAMMSSAISRDQARQAKAAAARRASGGGGSISFGGGGGGFGGGHGGGAR